MTKKVNSIIAWVVILLLGGHLATMSYSLLTGWYDYSVCKALAYLTAGFVSLHVLLSLIIVFFLHDGTRIGSYASMSKGTVIQRSSALAVLVLLHAHVTSFGFIAAGDALSMAQAAYIVVTEALFFAAIFAHLSVSASKSLITLGLLRSDAAEHRCNVVAAAVCVAGFALTSFALIRYIVMWPIA